MESSITLLAPRKAHIKITRLHESLRHSLRRSCIPYAALGKRLGFDFIQAKLKFDRDSLKRWQSTGVIRVRDVELPFDYLIVATGGNYGLREKAPQLLTVNEFCLNQGQILIRELVERKGRAVDITIVGGGATGIQFLFELTRFLRDHARRACQVRLVDYDERVLGQFPEEFHRYVCERMIREGVDYLPNTAFLRQAEESIVLATRESGSEFSLPSNLTLAFMGVKPNPFLVETNCYGQAVTDGELLDRVFAAGDCAHFEGRGANTLSAQVAVRKGKSVAENIFLHSRSAKMHPYAYAEQGYIVSLGSMDAVGWIKSTDKMVTGLAASALKTAIEKQYDLMLEGIDTYFP